MILVSREGETIMNKIFDYIHLPGLVITSLSHLSLGLRHLLLPPLTVFRSSRPEEEHRSWVTCSINHT